MNANRLGFLLTEEETERASILMMYMGKSPHQFLEHCINVLWDSYEAKING